MPPIKSKFVGHVIEAPSIASLDNARIREELFYLERTSSNLQASNQSLGDSIDVLESAVEKLTESVESLTISVDNVESLLKIILEKMRATDS